jgi:KDO2-lipid IV(A) lauroyltransferase
MQSFVTNCLLFVLRVFSVLPNFLIVAFGSFVGSILYYLPSQRKNIALLNLTLCFPKFNENKRQQIIKSHFKDFVISILQYRLIFYANSNKIKNLISIKNLEVLLEYYEKRPIILLLPHLVALDLAGLRLVQEIKVFSIYTEQKNKILTEKLTQARTRFANASGFPRRQALRKVVSLLSKNNVFVYLGDQDFGEKDSIYVPFFAVDKCASVNALPRLVSLTNSVVIPLGIYRRGLKYEIEFGTPWQNYPSGNLIEDVRQMNNSFEEIISKDLSQYFWLHKKFKSQPDRPKGYLYRNC